MLDDNRRETMPAIGDRSHVLSLSRTPPIQHAVFLTMPCRRFVASVDFCPGFANYGDPVRRQTYHRRLFKARAAGRSYAANDQATNLIQIGHNQSAETSDFLRGFEQVGNHQCHHAGC